MIDYKDYKYYLQHCFGGFGEWCEFLSHYLIILVNYKISDSFLNTNFTFAKHYLRYSPDSFESGGDGQTLGGRSLYNTGVTILVNNKEDNKPPTITNAKGE